MNIEGQSFTTRARGFFNVSRRIHQSETSSKSSGRIEYDVFDSPLEDIERFFYDILPFGQKAFAKYLKSRFAQKLTSENAKPLRVAELGGPALALARSLKEQMGDSLASVVGFTLSDPRVQDPKSYPPEEYHSVVVADIFSARNTGPVTDHFRNTTQTVHLLGREAMKEEVEKNGLFDFIVERMIWPISQLSTKEDARIFLLNVSRWYDCLSENGTLLLQTPVEMKNKKVKKVLEQIGGLSVRVSHNGILIEKNAGAPRTIKEALRDIDRWVF